MKKDLTALALAAVDNYARQHGVGNSLRGHDPIGEPQGLVTDPTKLTGLHASTDILVKDMAAMLMARWPGFRWAIQPSEVGGVFNVFCLDFHAVWGYVIRYDDVMNDPKRRVVLRAGRDILRRFGWVGERFDPVQLASLPRSADGQVIPHVSDLKPTRFTKKAAIELALATGHGRVVGTKGKGQIIEVHE